SLSPFYVRVLHRIPSFFFFTHPAPTEIYTLSLHDALPISVDVPVHSKRERNMRNGFANIRGNWLQAALSLKPSLLAEAMTHPGWVIEYIRHGGTPALENWLPYASAGATAEDTVKFNRAQVPAHAQTWKDLERYRRLFPRNLIVKGIMDSRDAIRAAE